MPLFRSTRFFVCVGRLIERAGKLAAITASLALAPLAPANVPACVDIDAPVFHDGRAVVRAMIRSARDLRTLFVLSKDVLSHRLDYGPADFILDSSALDALVASGIPHEILVGDLGPLLRADFASRTARTEGGVAAGDFFAAFRTLDEINAQLDAYAAQRPDLVTPFTIGTSLEGRPIRGIRITKASSGSPGVLFNATQHAREWGATTTALYIADRLIAGDGVDARVTALLARAWVDVIPVVNPDGYVYTWTTNRLWRKNRRNNGDGSFGVDLNRNWSFQWGTGGSSAVGSDETFRGPAPFTEPESAAMRDYFIANTTLAGHIDFHAYSQLVLSPWGYTTTPPTNNATFQALGQEMREAIFRTNGVGYTVGPIASTLYIASGSSVDHAFGQHGVPSFTIEVRDTGSYGFVMPAGEIIPNASENYAAALELADATVDGAVVRIPGGAPTSIDFGTPVSVEAEVSAIRGTLLSGGVTLHARVGGSGRFTQTVMSEATLGQFVAPLVNAPCGATIEWYMTAATTVGVGRFPRAAGTFLRTKVIDVRLTFVDTFETNNGWTVGATSDNAAAGQWTRVDPVGTIAQPESDSLDAGTLCFVTGQGVIGGAAGASDVDAGVTTLLSPILDARDADTMVVYRRWYSNNLGGAPNTDSMPISISSDGGLTWTILEDVVENAGVWVERRFRVADFVAPSANVQLRFQARDLATGSLVEAGVDFVRLETAACPKNPSDINGDGRVDAADLSELLNAWGAAGATDVDGSGTTDAADLSVVLSNWG